MIILLRSFFGPPPYSAIIMASRNWFAKEVLDLASAEADICGMDIMVWLAICIRVPFLLTNGEPQTASCQQIFPSS